MGAAVDGKSAKSRRGFREKCSFLGLGSLYPPKVGDAPRVGGAESIWLTGAQTVDWSVRLWDREAKARAHFALPLHAVSAELFCKTPPKLSIPDGKKRFGGFWFVF